MFLRTYSPVVDTTTQAFRGFQFKAVDFDEGCSVARVGTVKEGGGGPDPLFSEIYAVEFNGKCFLFKVESDCQEIGEIFNVPVVSAGVCFCDRNPLQLFTDISFDKSFLRSGTSIAYDYDDAAEHNRVLEFLKEGVRRINFSFDRRRAFSAAPQFYGEFRVHKFIMAVHPTGDGDLAWLLQMRNHISGFRALQRSGVRTRDRDALALISNADIIEQRVAEKQNEVLNTARSWIRDNDRVLPLGQVADILKNASNASKRSNIEWVLAQLVLLEPKVSTEHVSFSIEPRSLEEIMSEVWFQEIYRTIFQERFQAFFPSFESFFTRSVFTLARPYSVHERYLGYLKQKLGQEAIAEWNRPCAKKARAWQRECLKLWKSRNWRWIAFWRW